MGKKSQITLFVLLGLVVLLAIMFFTSLKGNKINAPGDAFDFKPIEKYEEACVRKASDDVLFKAASQGGYYLVGPGFDTINGASIAKYSKSKRLLPIEKERKNLEDGIREEIKNCADFSYFTSQGMQIEASEPSVTIDIQDENTIITVTHTAAVKAEGSLYSMKKKIISVPIRYGLAHEVAECFFNRMLDDKDNPINAFIAKKECLKGRDEFIALNYLNNRYVLIYDYKTWYNQYGKTFKYRFSID